MTFKKRGHDPKVRVMDPFLRVMETLGSGKSHWLTKEPDGSDLAGPEASGLPSSPKAW